jgi:hypothetical protein
VLGSLTKTKSAQGKAKINVHALNKTQMATTGMSMKPDNNATIRAIPQTRLEPIVGYARLFQGNDPLIDMLIAL